jgi:hypothetical protein
LPAGLKLTPEVFAQTVSPKVKADFDVAQSAAKSSTFSPVMAGKPRALNRAKASRLLAARFCVFAATAGRTGLALGVRELEFAEYAEYNGTAKTATPKTKTPRMTE